MKGTLHSIWIELLIAGLASLFFGVVIFTFPEFPLLYIIRIFAAYMIIKGLSLVIGAVLARRKESYWHFLFWYGILNIITGIVSVSYPEITFFIFGFIVSVNLLLSGILQILVALHLRKEIPAEGWLVLSGGITLVAGVYIYILPRISVNTILVLIAIASVVLSFFLITMALAAKNWHK